MKHFTKLLLSVLLIAGVTLGYAGKADRAKKIAEEGDKTAGAIVSSIEGNQVTTGGWFPQTLDPLAYDLRSVKYIAPGIVWVGGYNVASAADYIWRSYDNGGSWTKLPVPTQTKGFTFDARDSSLVVAGTFLGELIRSTDGGATWDTTYSYPDGYFDGVAFVGKDTVVAIGDADATGLLVLRSTDAGLTWERPTLPAADLAYLYGYATYRQCVSVYNNTVWMLRIPAQAAGRAS